MSLLVMAGPLPFVVRRAPFADRGAVLALLVLGVADAGSVGFYFAAIDRGPVAVAVLSHYLAPILVTLAAPLLLGERRSRRALTAAVISLFGIGLLVWHPGEQMALVTAGLGAASAVFYALFVFAGLLPWIYFSNAVLSSGGSLVASAGLVSKVYFPRLIVPTATVVTAFVDFLISFVILLGLMIYYQFAPSWNLLLLPVFILLALLASLGPGLWITALNVKYRDFRYIIPFIVQFGLYVSPVGFSSNVIPEQWRLLYSLNPMVGVIDGFRWCILGGHDSPIYWSGFLLSLTIVAFFLWLGVSQFRKMEKTFADLI
jgi:lipopolysaccharide transport system permease protein